MCAPRITFFIVKINKTWAYFIFPSSSSLIHLVYVYEYSVCLRCIETSSKKTEWKHHITLCALLLSFSSSSSSFSSSCTFYLPHLLELFVFLIACSSSSSSFASHSFSSSIFKVKSNKSELILFSSASYSHVLVSFFFELCLNGNLFGC